MLRPTLDEVKAIAAKGEGNLVPVYREVMADMETPVSAFLKVRQGPYSFLLESVSRLITIIFKLIPFVIGVDEAGAQFVGSTVALAAGMGVTLAIIRKGRIVFWTLIGLILIIKRGISISEITKSVDV